MIKILVILCGGSNSGKTVTQDYVSKKYNIPVCVSATTRPMRIGEINHVSYHFISEEKFMNDIQNGAFLENRVYQTERGIWYYGLPRKSVDITKTQITVVDQKGYYDIIGKLGKENVICIYLHAPEEEKIKRALEREKDRSDKWFLEFYRRMADDLTAFERCEKDTNIYKVENVDFDTAVKKIEGILQKKGLI